MLEERQQKLLELVIEQYVATAEPVGSRFLVEVGGLDWSEATVRNELRTLEEAGYLTHPHTSAGRIPTIDGYRFYIDTISPEKLKVSKAEMGALQEFFNDEMRRRGKFPYVVELQHNQTNKETRIRGLLPYYESKTVFHIKGHCEGLENELLTFPMGKHDDVTDSLAYQIQLAEQLVVKGPPLIRKPFMKYI